jgi:hypothetical protein
MFGPGSKDLGFESQSYPITLSPHVCQCSSTGLWNDQLVCGLPMIHAVTPSKIWFLRSHISTLNKLVLSLKWLFKDLYIRKHVLGILFTVEPQAEHRSLQTSPLLAVLDGSPSGSSSLVLEGLRVIHQETCIEYFAYLPLRSKWSIGCLQTSPLPTVLGGCLQLGQALAL